MFTGPFVPEKVLEKLQDLAAGKTNINIQRYTPHLLNYMENSELSISMSGYNKTMNILMTGIRAMMMAFTGNGDQEKTMRMRKLERMGIIKITHPQDLVPEKFAEQIINYLQYEPAISKFDFNGVEKTAFYLQTFSQEIKSVVRSLIGQVKIQNSKFKIQKFSLTEF